VAPLLIHNHVLDTVTPGSASGRDAAIAAVCVLAAQAGIPLSLTQVISAAAAAATGAGRQLNKPPTPTRVAEYYQLLSGPGADPNALHPSLQQLLFTLLSSQPRSLAVITAALPLLLAFPLPPCGHVLSSAAALSFALDATRALRRDQDGTPSATHIAAHVALAPTAVETRARVLASAVREAYRRADLPPDLTFLTVKGQRRPQLAAAQILLLPRAWPLLKPEVSVANSPAPPPHPLPPLTVSLQPLPTQLPQSEIEMALTPVEIAAYIAD
jgi:hypothetical protein